MLAIADAAKDRVRVEDFGDDATSGGRCGCTSCRRRRTSRGSTTSAATSTALADPRGAPPPRSTRSPRARRRWCGSTRACTATSRPASRRHAAALSARGERGAGDARGAAHTPSSCINPSSNPDGHERFTVWYNSVSVGDPDPTRSEHDEPWSVQGRFNHYRFDMNRDVHRHHAARGAGDHADDAALASDGRGRSARAGRRRTSFRPRRAPSTRTSSATLRKWLDLFGRANAAAFDRYGWMYYSRDVFDLYYPGYWTRGRRSPARSA